MEGCLAVSAEGKSGGLALLWREGMKVMMQNYSKYHIDSLVCLDDGMRLRFTGFYGQADPNNRNLSWDMLRRVKGTVNEGWIVAGDFNAILNNAEKEGGRKKPRSSMKDFCKLIEELALVDVKTTNGWFTWTNNREGPDLVKERLDRFLISDNLVGNMPFLTTKIVRQSKFDHEAIIMDTLGSKPRDYNINPRTWFRYDACWNKEADARDIITSIWSKSESNLLDKLELIRKELGPWQHQRYKRLKKKISVLEKNISDILDGSNRENTSGLLKSARSKLGYLYDVEERRLSREFTDKEILRAFNQMDPRKAPRIDGISGSFFKDHWQTVG
ncbi:hypothetical protein GOBAR_AA38752 [Gossypium barbadense]|uniref:Endonuclease/exonuclease/phosphatase domain-containing protein n=1 Tax=Gossypium barbadense TaxID=3634 RepID=A0A2P5VT38_GOSBA|nr:hypothetical protein GOBAR_AA38752 [Gossypium barbadense]